MTPRPGWWHPRGVPEFTPAWGSQNDPRVLPEGLQGHPRVNPGILLRDSGKNLGSCHQRPKGVPGLTHHHAEGVL